jgi:hypothetical protein
MDAESFVRIVQSAFSPFLSELGFHMEPPLLGGKFYKASFKSSDLVVSIYFEPGESFLLIPIFSVNDGKLSDIDDRSATPRIEDLNRRYMPLITPGDREKKAKNFDFVSANDDEEKMLLKRAEDLSHVLPMYLKDVVAKKR